MPPRPEAPGTRPRPVLGWRGRLDAAQRSLLRHRLALVVISVTRTYERGGGGMLAAGLAYFAFFTLVPALLLFASLLGVIVENRDLRDELMAGLVDHLDPIREVATVVIDGLADSGRTGTVIGILGLLWGASGFYGALQGAMQRMFPGPGHRHFLDTRVRGVLTVLLILGSMLLAVMLIVILPPLADWLAARCGTVDGLDVPLVEEACSISLGGAGTALTIAGTVGTAILGALLIYVVIPPDGASLRQASWPAVVAGVAIGAFTSLFALIAPLLVRQWLALGIVGSVFISLVWLNLVFQALVYGAAFARLRRDRDRARTGPPAV